MNTHKILLVSAALALLQPLVRAQDASPNSSHDGTWLAVTSQKKDFKLVVKGGLVSEIEFQYSVPGGTCFPVGDGSGAVVYLPELQNTVRVYGWGAQYAPKVQGNKVAVSRTETSGGANAAPIFYMEGVFGSDGTLSGTIRLTAVGTMRPPDPPCQTTATVQFKARREGDSAAPGTPPAESRPDPKAGEAGRRLIGAARAAIGGEEQLARLRDVTVVESAAIAASPGTKATRTTRWIAPGTIRIDQDMVAAKITIFWNGSSGWMRAGQAVVPIQGQGAALVKIYLQMFPLWPLFSGADSKIEVKAAGPDVVEISDGSGGLVRLELEPATRLPAKMTCTIDGRTVTQSLLDWRLTDGVRFPYKVAMQQDGGRTLEWTAEQVSLNTGLTAEDLDKKF